MIKVEDHDDYNRDVAVNRAGRQRRFLRAALFFRRRFFFGSDLFGAILLRSGEFVRVAAVQ
jgi:hypothetical protein